MRTRSDEAWGLGMALGSAALFGTSGVFATSLLAAGWTPGAAVAARLSLASLVLTAPAVVLLRGRWRMLRAHAGRLVVYGVVAVAGCQFTYFSAVQHLQIGVALLLEYSGTLLVVGWLWLRHGQRPRALTIAGTAVAVAGLALVLGVTGSVRLSLVGVAWGVVAAVCLAIFFVLSAGPPPAGAPDDSPSGTARAQPESLHPVVMTWGGTLVGATGLGLLGLVGALPLHATTAPVTLLGHALSWLVPVLGLALLGGAGAYVAGIAAARLLGPKLSAFLGLTEVCFAVVFAWLALGQLPAPAQVAGGVLVLAGVALVRADELRRSPAPSPVVGEQVERARMAP